MNIIEQADLQVAQAEAEYFKALNLVAELLGRSHDRDPRLKKEKEEN
jgi:hypothetical protein